MKKLLILATMACAALVSCVKNEPAPSVTAQQEITFAPPVVGVTTKGEINLPATYPTTDSFGVFAYYYANEYNIFSDGAIYMNDVTVSSKENTTTIDQETATHTWQPTENYYWPKTGSLTFVAYSPASINNGQTKIATYTDNGILFSDYVVDKNANQDLMFSDRTYNVQESNQKINTDKYYGVDIKFNHALSAILFQVKAAEKLVQSGDGDLKYEFYVQKIEVLNAYSKGDFNQGLDDQSQINTPIVTTGFTNDWTNQEEEMDSYIAYEATKTNGTYGADAGLHVNSTLPVSEFDSTPNDGNNGNNGKAELILLPQKLTHGEGDDAKKVEVKVTYKLRHSNMKEGVWIENNVVTADLTTSGVPEWFRGKRYIYTLTIDLNEIYLSPAVSDWTDGTTDSIEVTVDNQVTSPAVQP